MIKEKAPLLARLLLRSKITVILEVLILVLISAALAKEITRRYQIRSEIRKLQASVQRLEEKNTELGSFVSRLNSGTYQEEQARLKLGLQKPGESVVVVLGESTDGQESTATAHSPQIGEENKQTTSNPQRWWKYFLKTSKETSAG